MSYISRMKNAIGMFVYYYISPNIKKLGACGSKTILKWPADLKNPKNVFLGENVYIGSRSTFMTVGEGKCIIKDQSGAAEGLTVICSTHEQKVGSFMERTNNDNVYYDIVVEEDVWIGANVTLLPGARIGRGSIVGAGAVVRSKIPPYAVVYGNPAKIVGFKFTPEEVLIHEKNLYAEIDRLPIELLENNYNKYFINRIKEIKDWSKL